jgi:HAMP domain-containing protein
VSKKRILIAVVAAMLALSTYFLWPRVLRAIAALHDYGVKVTLSALVVLL